MPRGEGRRRAGDLLRPAGRPREPQHARDGEAELAAARKRPQGASRTRADELLRGIERQRVSRGTRPTRCALPPTATTRRASCSTRRGGYGPIPGWRRRAATSFVQAALLLAAATWIMSTDEMTALASVILDVHQLKHVSTAAAGRRRDRARTLAGRAAARAPARRRGHGAVIRRWRDLDEQHGDFAALARRRHRPRRARIGGVPTLGRDRYTLRAQARSLGVAHRQFYFLSPRGLTPGQMLMARTAGATPVYGELRLGARGGLPHHVVRAGDILVITADGSRRVGIGHRAHRLLAWRERASCRAALLAHELALHQRQQERRTCERGSRGDQQREEEREWDTAARRRGECFRRRAAVRATTGTTV